MSVHPVPKFLADRFYSTAEALHELVKSGATIGSGFGPSEPLTFYEHLWDYIQAEDIRDLSIRSAFFMGPHKLCLGSAMQAKGLFDGLPESGFIGSSMLSAIGKRLGPVTKKLDGLSRLVEHYKELQERRIRFISPFLSPVTNMVIPDNPMVRTLYPEFAGRNTTRLGVTDYHAVHFPDAMDSIAWDADGAPRISTYVMVMTPPDEAGEMSHGLSNGVNQDILERAIRDRNVNILLYLNPNYPFTRGYNEARNTIHVDELKPLAELGRLFVVEDSNRVPSLPPNSLSNPLPEEITIADNLVNHIEQNLRFTQGRTMQVGFGGTGVLAIKRLKDSAWTGRQYSEMLEPFTLDLFDAGKITGSHFIEKNGTRTQLDGKLVCTFTLAEANTDFNARIDHNPAVVVASAGRVVIPEGFYHGMGINNCLAIDFNGHVNVSGRYENHHSGMGGAAMIGRGLAKGGVGYLCMKSTHSSADGKRRSSIFPQMPQGTPIGLIGADITGGRDSARFFLVTEQGVTQLSGCSQSQLIANLISVAHPDFRDWLRHKAREIYGQLA